MRYQISGIHIDVGDALQTHVKAELNGEIRKYAERPTDAQVIFSKSGHEFVCEKYWAKRYSGYRRRCHYDFGRR